MMRSLLGGRREVASVAGARITLAGRIAVQSDRTVLDERALPGRQPRVAFSLLVLERDRPVARDELAASLWGEDRPATWEPALRGVVSRVRTFVVASGLGEGNTLRSDAGTYRLHLLPDVQVDLEVAAWRLRQAEAALRRGEAAAAVSEAGEARGVLVRPLLSGADGEWVETRRRELTHLLLRSLEVLADGRLALGQLADAVAAADAALVLDPFREPMYRTLMSSHTRAGDYAAGLLTFDRCRRKLANELGVDPSPATRALHLELLGNELQHDDPVSNGPREASNASLDRPVGSDVPPYVGLRAFGRADLIDRTALERLVGSVSRFLDQDPPTSGGNGEVEPVDGRDLGGAWVLDELWGQFGIGKAVVKVARGRKLDARSVERALFALVASRALAPSSKLEATRWVREEVYIDGLAEIDTDSCYRAMDFLLESLPELQETVFLTVADLLQLDVDLLFFDTTSTYFGLEQPDVNPDDETAPGFRSHGHSKDHRDDLPQAVIGMAVTRGGLPVRLWVWPGFTQDQTVLAEVKQDLAGWQLNRTVWVVDAGFASADNRQLLQAGGSGFIVAERLRGNELEVAEARSRQGRYRKIDEQLEVKEILLGEGPTTQRFIMCRNHEVARRDAAIRDKMIDLLTKRSAGSDQLTPTKRAELRGRLKEKPGLNRYLRVTKTGLLRVDKTKIKDETALDGRYLLRTSDLTIPAEDVARGYKALADVERGWRDMKQLELRPIYHRRADRIVGHVQLCWLALLLIRTIENQVGDTWRNISHELDRMQLITLETATGCVSQRTRTTQRQREILDKLGLAEPPRYFEFTPTGD
jgi:DNA-binding SARP family transcriptional activator/transposase